MVAFTLLLLADLWAKEKETEMCSRWCHQSSWGNMTIKENPRAGKRWWSQKEWMYDGYVMSGYNIYADKKQGQFKIYPILRKISSPKGKKNVFQQAKENGSAEL